MSASDVVLSHIGGWPGGRAKLPELQVNPRPGQQEVGPSDEVVLEVPPAAEIDAFADAILNDTDPPNGLVNAARAAVISFKVNESISAGCPIAITESDYTFR